MQDAYSFRCAPQVHGASRDLLDYVGRHVAIELNAATDNPLVLLEAELIVSNGNFHGQPVAFALDALRSHRGAREHLRAEGGAAGQPGALGRPAAVSGAREEGLNSGFMILQYVAAALVSENKVLAIPPRSTRSPRAPVQEDHVSMGNGAGLKALQVVANAERVLAIELL